MSIPEVVRNEKAGVDSVFLRTVLKKEVHDRLKDFAMAYSTGQGNWDFGVAIQILLDHYDESKLGLQAEKLDHILGMLQGQQREEPPQEEPYTEMLGGSKIKH